MRVNVYAEEQTDLVDVIEKDGFTGVRFWLHLPVTVNDGNGTPDRQIQGPFMHHPEDDDSSAVTFWGKKDMRTALRKALNLLDKHYDGKKYANSINPHNSTGQILGSAAWTGAAVGLCEAQGVYKDDSNKITKVVRSSTDQNTLLELVRTLGDINLALYAFEKIKHE